MVVIDLAGPEGNAFALIGKARVFARQLGLDPKGIQDQMFACESYDSLLEVFESHFKHVARLVRR